MDAKCGQRRAEIKRNATNGPHSSTNGRSGSGGGGGGTRHTRGDTNGDPGGGGRGRPSAAVRRAEVSLCGIGGQPPGGGGPIQRGEKPDRSANMKWKEASFVIFVMPILLSVSSFWIVDTLWRKVSSGQDGMSWPWGKYLSTSERPKCYVWVVDKAQGGHLFRGQLSLSGRRGYGNR